MPPTNQPQPGQQPLQPAVSTGSVGNDAQFQPPAAGVQPASTPSPSKQQAQEAHRKANTTQNSLLFSEIRDNMIIMADGSFRSVIVCKSINFDLMSARERDGVEFSYQNFLNALYFPIQIFIRSQRVDIGPYLDKLTEIRRTQDNMLLGVLMDDYINFIDILSQEANIMDKSFFVIVPYFPAGDINSIKSHGKGLFDKFFGANKAVSITKIDKDTYAKAKEEIGNRINSVVSGLTQVGIQAVPLKTKELGELYYNIYNPDTAVREPLGDFDNITSTYVRKGGAPLSTPPTPQPPQPTPGGAR